MSFDNSTMKPPRLFKPHIALIRGYWRVSQYPHERYCGFYVRPCDLPANITVRWLSAHNFAHRENAAREFGMVTPNATK